MSNVNVSGGGKSGGVFLTLFSIPFAGVGVVMAVVIIWTLSLTLFAIIWNGVVVGIYLAKAPYLFLIIFGGVGIILILCSLYSWLNKYKIEIDIYSIKLSGGFMGIGSRKEIDVKELREFGSKITSNSNSATFYKVFMTTISNEKYKVASGLKGKPLTEAFIAELENQINKE